MHRIRGGVCLPGSCSAVLFASLAFLFYAPSWNSYFVSDDYEFLGRVTLAGAARYWRESWGYGNEYRPLLVYTYALNAVWSGANPAGYHLFNTALHVANGLLLMWCASRLGIERRTAWLAAVFFLLNPVGHESVLWISGRPVLLSALFLLLSAAALLKAQEPGRRWWHVLVNLFLCLGLISYEGAAAIPFVLLLIQLCTGRGIRAAVVSCLAPFAILAVYVLLWNGLFSGRVQRFPVETSFTGGLSSLLEAFGHSFHGVRRPAVAPFYALLLAPLLADRAGRRLAAACGAFFIAAYLPFLIVRGFADRFAYASSLAAALLLSGAAGRSFHRHSRRTGALLAAAFALFFAAGMWNRMTMWRQAGEIARRIPAQIKRLRPLLPPGATVVVLDAPDMHKHALVFLTGLERAVMLQYPNVNLRVRRRTAGACDAESFVFRVRGAALGECKPRATRSTACPAGQPEAREYTTARGRRPAES